MNSRCLLCVALALFTLTACGNRRSRFVGDGGSFDAGPRTDAGPAIDAAGLDLGMGVDLGPPVGTTTCSIGVAPLVAPVTSDFVFTGASNGSACSASVDDGAPLAMPCNGMMGYPGELFGVGSHMVQFAVGAGPSGPTRCLALFTVSGSGSTTCNVTVTPTVGTTTTTFVADFTSDGSACSGDVDGLSIGTVDCLGSFNGMGSLIGVGEHLATLSVSAGPGGPTSCSAPFTVVPVP